MILPGTLVQRVRPSQSGRLRVMGIYTVSGSYAFSRCCACGADACTAIYLAEVDNSPTHLRMSGVRPFVASMPGYSLCGFRIIAPPITEADRLEASAPDAPAKPKRVRA